MSSVLKRHSAGPPTCPPVHYWWNMLSSAIDLQWAMADYPAARTVAVLSVELSLSERLDIEASAAFRCATTSRA